MYSCEDAIAVSIDCDAEEKRVGREGRIGDESMYDSGIRNGDDGWVAEGAEYKVLTFRIPSHGLGKEIR